MKNLLFLLLPIAFATATSAQNKQVADTVAISGLPVLRSYVAPDVVERAKKKYGRSLYCIETSKAENCENSFLVGILRNGRLNMEWMCDDPKMVLHVAEKHIIHTKTRS
ncbi:MAG TPA: hypothetical protein VER36_07765 [Flavisolibacter sp.]|nr:hypothetical protein [Flavisolibacter sp.]